MPRRPLRPSTVSAATAAMFDLLADGQWWDTAHLQQVGAAACARQEPDAARARGEKVLRRSIARGRRPTPAELVASGANEIARNNLMIAVRSGRVQREGHRHRMLPEAVAQWRAARPPAAPARKPLVFGGIPEEQGFAAAPLVSRDRVHFRADRPLPLPAFRCALPTGVTVALDEGEGLYRVEGSPGSGHSLAAHIKQWCAAHGIRTIGLRPEADVRRRHPRDLPADFLADLCSHYQRFSLKRLQRHMSTIRIHIPDPDDVGQQVSEWILDAVARYDADKQVPFGAFLAGQLSKWVHDLGRNTYGRTLADAENRQRKAVAAFTAEHQRRPSEQELAAYLGQTVGALRDATQAVATLNGLRHARSIDAAAEDDPVIPLPDAHDATEDVLSEVDQTLVSHALTAACAPDAQANGRAAQPNVLGWATWYFATWGGMTKTDLARELGTSIRNMNVYADRAGQRMRDRLADVVG